MQQLSLSDLMEHEKGRIWIINTSSAKYPSGAEVFITINNNGANSMYVVPRTWLPQEVTAKYSRKVILESNYFVSALTGGLVTAITDEDAKKLLTGPKAERERVRLEEIQNAITEASSARGIGKNVSISTGDPEADEALLAAEASSKVGSKGFIKNISKGEVDFNDDEEPEDPVGANFKGWVGKLNSMEDQGDVESEIKMRGKMSLDEAMYLLRNVDHEGVQEKLKAKLRKIGQEV
jgi:hypothetical protein